jgi:hypothetical protein
LKYAIRFIVLIKNHSMKYEEILFSKNSNSEDEVVR